jgi:hypothetical protein
MSDPGQMQLPPQIQAIVSMIPGGWNIFNTLFGDCSRPYSQYVCSSAIAFCTVWSCVVQNEAIFFAAIAAAAGLAGGQAFLRTQDKKIAASASSTDQKTAAVAAGGQP